MMNRFEMYFDANYTYILPKQTNFIINLGLLKNSAFVIMSPRKNIRLIARASYIISFPPKPSPSQQKKEKDCKLLKWIGYFE